MVIASPWSRGGYVNSEVFDHTSCLQFLENFLSHKTGKKIKEENISDWRRTVCGDLTSVFRPYNGEKLTPLKFLNKEASAERIHKAKFKKLPGGYKNLTVDEISLIKKAPHLSPYMAKQEPGIKPSSALPYELYADGKLSDDKKSFEIKFKAGDDVFGKLAAGSPFSVYAPGNYTAFNESNKKEPVRTWNYALKAGDELSDAWPIADFENNNYHLRVYGPNGFYREFKGDNKDAPLDVNFAYHKKAGKLTGHVELTFSITPNGDPLTVDVIDNSYKTGTRQMIIHGESFKAQTMLLELGKNHNWYDFSVKVRGYGNHVKRYAGRVETGTQGYTDPLMGRAIV
jgi:phospholipase C